MPQINLDNIVVDVVLKNIKNVHLRVYPPMGGTSTASRVCISAPKRMSINTIRDFVITKMGWIKKQQTRLREQVPEAPQDEAGNKAQMNKAVPPLLAKWQPVLGVRVERFFLQRMKTRWGSCNYKKYTIRLNTALATKPPECLEYVVVHELVHLLEPTHNARFKALMTQFVPNWKLHRQTLNRLIL